MRQFSLAILVALMLGWASPALGDAISNIQFDPGPVSAMRFNQDVNITFDHTVATPGGVRIWARPITQGELTPNHAASGPLYYPPGVGSGTGYFTITTGDHDVDAVRFQMWDETQTTLLLEIFVPVDYSFRQASMYNASTNPNSPAGWLFGEDITVEFT